MTNMAITPPPPRPKRLFEVLVRLHDDVGQLKYPYSAKILKWGIIQESELEEASKDNPNASEKTVWEDVRPADVAVRIAGGLTQFVDQEGFRAKWVEHGLAEGSWKIFLSLYCRLKADATPFNSDGWHRNSEMDNLLTLVRILDEEVFSHAVMNGPTNHDAAMKSKWWKECHRRLADAIEFEVYRGMDLPAAPKDGLC